MRIGARANDARAETTGFQNLVENRRTRVYSRIVRQLVRLYACMTH